MGQSMYSCRVDEEHGRGGSGGGGGGGRGAGQSTGGATTSGGASAKQQAARVRRGLKLYEAGNAVGAIACWRKALEKTDNPVDRFGLLSYVAMAAHDVGSLLQLVEAAKLQLLAARRTNRSDLIAEASLNMARGYVFVAEFDRAMYYCAQCLEHTRQGQVPSRLEGYAHYTLAQTSFWTGQISQSLQRYDKSLIAAKSLNDEVLELLIFLGLGQTFFALRDYHKALLYFTRANKMAAELQGAEFDKFRRQVSYQVALGQLKIGNNETAARLLEQVEGQCALARDQDVGAFCALVKADVHTQSGRPLWGYWEAESAVNQLDGIQARAGKVLGHLALGRAAQKLAEAGNVCQCKPLEIFQNALELASSTGAILLRLRCLEKLEVVYRQLNDSANATFQAEQAAAIRERLKLVCTACRQPIGEQRDSLEIVACAHILHERCARKLKSEQLGRTLGSLRPVYCPDCRKTADDSLPGGEPSSSAAAAAAISVSPTRRTVRYDDEVAPLPPDDVDDVDNPPPGSAPERVARKYHHQRHHQQQHQTTPLHSRQPDSTAVDEPPLSRDHGSASASASLPRNLPSRTDDAVGTATGATGVATAATEYSRDDTDSCQYYQPPARPTAMQQRSPIRHDRQRQRARGSSAADNRSSSPPGRRSQPARRTPLNLTGASTGPGGLNYDDDTDEFASDDQAALKQLPQHQQQQQQRSAQQRATKLQQYENQPVPDTRTAAVGLGIRNENATMVDELEVAAPSRQHRRQHGGRTRHEPTQQPMASRRPSTRDQQTQLSPLDFGDDCVHPLDRSHPQPQQQRQQQPQPLAGTSRSHHHHHHRAAQPGTPEAPPPPPPRPTSHFNQARLSRSKIQQECVPTTAIHGNRHSNTRKQHSQLSQDRPSGRPHNDCCLQDDCCLDDAQLIGGPTSTDTHALLGATSTTMTASASLRQHYHQQQQQQQDSHPLQHRGGMPSPPRQHHKHHRHHLQTQQQQPQPQQQQQHTSTWPSHQP